MPRWNLDRFLQLALVASVIALVVVVADAVRVRVVNTGDMAPEFVIHTDNGLTLTRSNFGGRLLVLNFWASWCPPCIEEMPSLERFYQELKDEGVVVVGVSVDEDEAAYRRMIQRFQLTFLTARDPEASLSARFGTFRYPETYIIDAQGRVVQKIIGAADWMDPRLLDYVRSMLGARRG